MNREELKGKLYIGQYNTKLTDKGRQSAVDLQSNNYIKEIQRIYTSDLDRSIETAKLVTNSNNIIIDKNLRERSLGVFEGKLESELKNEYIEFFKLNEGIDLKHSFTVKVPNGENYIDVCNRCNEFLKTIKLEDITIGVFSHYCFIRCMIYILMDITEEDILKLGIRNCEPLVLEGNKIGEFKLKSHNIENLIY